MDNHSLRVKLIAVMALVVSLASFPLIYLSYQDSYDRAIESAREDFDTTVRLVEEGVKLSYLNSQTMVTEKVKLEHTWLSEVLDAYQQYIAEGRGNELMVIEKWNKLNDTFSAQIAPDGRFILSSPVIEDLYKRDIPDFLDVTLKEYQQLVNASVTGEYTAFFRGTRDEARNLPLLLVMRKASDGSMLVVAEELSYVESHLQNRREAVEGHLKDVMDALPHLDGTISVMTGSGRYVAGRGEGALIDYLAGSPEVYDKAKKDGIANGILKTSSAGEILYSLRYFAPLDWYIETTVPTSFVAAPARAYAAKLTTIVLCIFLVLVMLGLGTVTRVLTPLRSVAESAGRLAGIDLASSSVHEQLGEIRTALPPPGGDEVGKVADAFRHLTLAMEDNIDALKRSVAKQHSLEGELRAANEIQQGMLTVGPDGVKDGRFEASALMIAAKEVGGDLFDVLKAPDGRRAILLGDVSGKGVSAALLMCVTLTLARLGISRGYSPAETMKLVNDHLAANNPSCMFVTLWIGLLDVETGRLTFANGGHPAPCVAPATAGGEVRWVRDLSGPLVGVMEEAQFEDRETTLSENEVMLVYSDGVTEAMDVSRKLFSEARLGAAVAAAVGESPKLLVEKVLSAVTAHRGEADQSDDITMVAFVKKGGAA